ncbi:MAG TPA: Gfo/Idh/MocA family oxidoreductase [Acidothermaceae bacterium]
MSELRLGIVGLHNHYHAYPFADQICKGIDGVRLVAVADERPELAKSFGEKYCDGDWTTDYAQLIRRDDIDAVIITSYTSAHADHVELAAAAGKHVLLDKPIATTLADAQRIVEAGKSVKIMLAYLLRYLPAYRQVFAAVEEGAVGDLVSGFYSIRFPAGFIKDNPDADDQGWYRDPIKGGGGGFIDHGVHFTDFFRWFFKSEAATVTAHIGSLTYKDLGVEDYGIATYTLENGAIVTVESTWHAPDYFGPLSSPDHASLSGTRGEIELHYQKSPQTEIQGVDEPWVGRRYFDFVGEDRYERCYRDLVVAFAEAIRDDREPSPNAVDGYKALEWILGAYESHRTGQRVTFPLAPSGETL